MIYGPGPDPTVRHDSQINLPIYMFKLFKTTRRNETELNSFTTIALYSHTLEAQDTDLIPLSCISVFKIHMLVGLRLRHNTVNISVSNHDGEPMGITQAMCKLCAIVPVNVLTSVIQKVKVKNLTKLFTAALTTHILSETTRDESTSTCADNSIN